MNRLFLLALLLFACQQPAPPAAPPEAPAVAPAAVPRPGGVRLLGRMAPEPANWWSATSASDQTSPTLDTDGYDTACFQLTMAATGTPVGSFAVKASTDNSHFDALHIDADRAIGDNFTNAGSYPGGYSVAVSSPGGVVHIQTCVRSTPRYLQVLWDNTSGGAAGAITGAVRMH